MIPAKLRKTLMAVVALALSMYSATCICVAGGEGSRLVGAESAIPYEEYLSVYSGAEEPQDEIVIDGAAYVSANMPGLETLRDHGGSDGESVLTAGRGYIEWEFTVENPGFYNIEVEYCAAEGRSSALQRELWINGELPFSEAAFLTFSRAWRDTEAVRIDNQGNHLRPCQAEAPIWQKAVLSDQMGNYQRPLLFYFGKGNNRIRLVSILEPMIIRSVRLFQMATPKSYAEVSADYGEKGFKAVAGFFEKVQGEDAYLKSSPTLFQVHDAGDPTVEPYHHVLIRLNAIGGDRWTQPGEWIAWHVEVPKDGLYKIALKAKQDYKRGSFTNRRLYVNGDIPFAEVDAIRFPYAINYEMRVLGDDVGEPYLFYLHEGVNEIRLEPVLGDLGPMLLRAEAALYDMNTVYRKIVMITSTNPDPMRDYQLEERVPELISKLAELSEVMRCIGEQLEAYTGARGDYVALLYELARQLGSMAKKPESIPKRIAELRDAGASLGSWILSTREQPLMIDYIVVASIEQEMPKAKPTWLQRFKHEVKAFLASFVHRYDLVGNVYSTENGDGVRPLKVWIGAGRDQAQALKSMIEDSFTPATGIPVNLELVSMGVLLPATLSGNGPDVALGLDPAQPLNFALRGAVVSLTQFPDYPEVAARFRPSAMTPFSFRDQVYALPEQQPFPVMFYRKDILREMGISLPETWDDLIGIIPELQKSHMDIGLPVSGTGAVGAGNVGEAVNAGSVSSNAGVMTFLTLLYQNGGRLYGPDGLCTGLDDEEAVDAFTRWTELHELYTVPLDYNAINRFRIGEMPILITGYTLYNTLSVFAPELRGEWGFTLVPGTRRPDGSIDRSCPAGSCGAGGVPGLASSVASGPATVIMSSAPDLEGAWEFVKWWTSTETQVRFGREMESLMGPSARYPSANVDAVQELPWKSDECQMLMEQWEWVRGIPEVPGGYMVGRHLDNAFRRVVYHHEPPREVLLDYNRMINEEITMKRLEFGLPVRYDELEAEWCSFDWQ
ncbi:MAG TPA: extracellular solute-binding protein [Bacillota bacterium]|nr:extracellular solute-binding protein [Bacillota bacterium]